MCERERETQREQNNNIYLLAASSSTVDATNACSCRVRGLVTKQQMCILAKNSQPATAFLTHSHLFSSTQLHAILIIM